MTLTAIDRIWAPPPEDRRAVYRAGDRVISPLEPDCPPIPPMPRFIEVQFLSPVRVPPDGKLVAPGQFRAADLFGFLVRRVSMLSTFHTDTSYETDFAGLRDLAHQVRLVERDLVWHGQNHWSATRKDTIDMSGLSGWVVLELTEAQAPLWPYLWLAPWIHAGKAATRGLGAVALMPA